MAYGATLQNIYKVVEKAKTKADGCYQMLGIAYRVRDGKVTHYAANKKIYIPQGNFDVEVGSYEGYSDDALKALKAIK